MYCSITIDYACILNSELKCHGLVKLLFMYTPLKNLVMVGNNRPIYFKRFIDTLCCYLAKAFNLIYISKLCTETVQKSDVLRGLVYLT